ncbi:MAG: hypothetical protein ACOYL5_13345 [Phototrophicaceae bacterium]|jgi:hypothetical protein
MKAQRRNFIILGGVFGLLLLAVILQGSGVRLPSFNPTPTIAFDPLERSVFTNFGEGNISAIRISTPLRESSLILIRNTEGLWTAPALNGTLDIATAELIARTVTLLPYYQTLPLTDETNLYDFGFIDTSPTAMVIEIILENEDIYGLYIGGLTPTQNAYYAITDRGETLYLVEPRAVEFLRQALRQPPIVVTPSPTP